MEKDIELRRNFTLPCSVILAGAFQGDTCAVELQTEHVYFE